jgi:hypothetical protein
MTFGPDRARLARLASDLGRELPPRHIPVPPQFRNDDPQSKAVAIVG